ncbi:Nucleolar complex-associated domain-containing protein [Rozella allomycis CSF55]|uniref:Nucleolar complex-associated domain-containing protein n=1 Tax=Rozella allomycis (strain CSF55) TaxID=988480 RepID=A0A075AWV9_ROZAC|nr:Nucleolar complex-associated domain-containing protein [Rozella allomycis CSF55]|eukprot:EPZ33192.1 Nucleolar complex-associated domain-containing protein [Rozella allomycis CSF55]
MKRKTEFEVDDGPRRWKEYQEDNTDFKLPYKGEDGRWKKEKIRPKEIIEQDDEEFKEEQKEESGDILTEEKMAQAALDILSDPQENLGQLKKLKTSLKNSKDEVHKIYLILTLCSLYKDLIPEYRIRPLTEKELNMKVSNDVKKLRDFEQTFLSHYQGFLKEVEFILSSKTISEKLLLACIECLCQLMIKAPYFNFFKNIVSIVGRFTLNSVVGEKCCNSMKALFQGDESGTVSLQGIQVLYALIKKKKFNVPCRVIETFTFLKLRYEYRASVNDKPKMSKNQKKKLKKDEKMLEKEMKEAEAIVAFDEKQAAYKETLKLIFYIYSQKATLLVSVLKGISKFVHLVDYKLVVDIIKTVKERTNDEKLTLDQGLSCVMTAVAAAENESMGEQMDLKQFYVYLYNLIDQFAKKSFDIEVVETCFKSLFFKRFQPPVNRVASFAHKLSKVAINLDDSTIRLKLFNIIVHLFIKYPGIRVIAGNEQIANGVYLEKAKDPDMASPLSTKLLEYEKWKKMKQPELQPLLKQIKQFE